MCVQSGYKTVTPIEIANCLQAHLKGELSYRGVRVFVGCLAMVAVWGNNPLGTAMRADSGQAYGLYTTAPEPVRAMVSADGGIGIISDAFPQIYSTSKAGYFHGDVQVTGALSKGGGSFKIDDPLDPANKYLYHSFVESPDMKNIYDGIANLDGNGEAWVELPKWFEMLNNNFRYQLTPIGAYAPLYIAAEIQNNRFQIAGGKSGMKVSWSVTGIRQDAWANAHRIPVESEKTEEFKGTYLYPEELGFPDTSGEDFKLKSKLPVVAPADFNVVPPVPVGDLALTDE